MNILEKLGFYFSNPIVYNALLVAALISVCAALLGVTLVLKRLSFIGDGLSHVAFGAIAVSAVLNLTENMYFVLPVTVLSAVLLLKTGKNTRLKGDAAIATLSVSSLAIGYLLMNVFSTSGNVAGDVCSTLFGTTAILTLSKADVWLCVIASLIVIGIYIFFYSKIFAVTFDEDFARATGIKTGVYNLIVSVTVAVIIVLGMKLIGSLLISALVIFPPLCAMRIYKSFKAVTVCSVILALTAALMGFAISIAFSTPLGATIVAVNLLIFLGFSIVGKLK